MVAPTETSDHLALAPVLVAALTLSYLLVAYLWLIPALANPLPVKIFAVVALIGCFLGNTFLIRRYSPNIAKPIWGWSRALIASALITLLVFLAYLAIATVLRGA